MSKKVYCLAQFRAKQGRHDELFQILQNLESDVLREDGCLQYIVTQQIKSDFATDESDFPIVFNEIWADIDAFEAHCQRSPVQAFFEQQCVAETGAAEQWHVSIYSDEPNGYEAPKLPMSSEV
ncbi:putative quinol monooxygenase [Echinimonas agarilytica]|uniref:Antibiotic biosynthesis monooxygenase n=1 Tax=Echinimonas agarilytica TaxID=1215918 RepID=A0AA42B8N2_9GAMM|nr:antibiotic biosynthesis monooxygenase [Echinimonas agarilytica]MCM2681067.1 antibiotic biosynthesis monooxygenase [Echinimonas agarilytica]